MAGTLPPIRRGRERFSTGRPLRPRRERSIVGNNGLGGVWMQANVGDRLVVEGMKVDAPKHEGEVVEVRGADGAPPYVVRWSDGHEGLTYPGPDAHVIPKG